MRISTSMIYDRTVSGMQSQMSSIMHTQQQISSGKRLVSASDDPSASSQILQMTETQNLNKQFGTSQEGAQSTLALLDGQLQGVTDLIQYVQTRAVSAANGTLNAGDLKSMAADIQSQFDDMVGLANSTDGLGQYIFAGNMASSKPFAGDLSTGITYQGDQGVRAVQVSQSRQLPVSVPGDSLFMGNPYVTAEAASSTASSSVTSSSVSVPGALTGNSYQIQVKSDGTYQVVNPSLPSTSNVVKSGTFTSGSSIDFDGVSITLSGSVPASGSDTFNVGTGTPGIFDTLSNLVKTMQNPTTGDPAANSSFKTQIGAAMSQLTSALDTVLDARATVGSRMNEVTGLQSMNSSLDLQYSKMRSSLEDTDYASAISSLAQQQMSLQAAQKSFLQVTSLSLFNYMS